RVAKYRFETAMVKKAFLRARSYPAAGLAVGGTAKVRVPRLDFGRPAVLDAARKVVMVKNANRRAVLQVRVATTGAPYAVVDPVLPIAPGASAKITIEASFDTA